MIEAVTEITIRLPSRWPGCRSDDCRAASRVGGRYRTLDAV